MADIPNVAGVPALLTGFASAASSGNIGLMVSDLVSFAFGSVGDQWGIFQNGASVVSADNVLSVDFKRDWAIADYPLEGGKFETYGKVQIPFMPRVRFSAGGDMANRQALLDSIEAIAGDFLKYDVATPEKTYTNVNIHHYDYHRAANSGVGLIVVDVWLQEVRVAVSEVSGGSKAASPSGSGASVSGAGSPGDVASNYPSSWQNIPTSPYGANTATPSAASSFNMGSVSSYPSSFSGTTVALPK